MTFSKLTWHKRTHGHKFTGAEFRVLMSIFDHSSADGTNSHPGIKLLIEETGYRKAAISQALTALQDRGWITQTRKGSGVSGHTSVFALVPDAPRPPSRSAVADQPSSDGRSTGVDQPTEVGLLERTSWSTGVDVVGPLEWTPTDPDTRSGSDPDRSDQEEVRHPPNHLEDQDETGLGARSPAVAGSNSSESEPACRAVSSSTVGIPSDAGIGVRPHASGPDSDPWGGSTSIGSATADPEAARGARLSDSEWHPPKRTASSRRPSFAERVEEMSH